MFSSDVSTLIVCSFKYRLSYRFWAFLGECVTFSIVTWPDVLHFRFIMDEIFSNFCVIVFNITNCGRCMNEKDLTLLKFRGWFGFVICEENCYTLFYLWIENKHGWRGVIMKNHQKCVIFLFIYNSSFFFFAFLRIC